ncbi:MAG TPA: TrmH family RNA methyltransferase, partial [Rhodospirillales bacterium]
RLFDTAAAAVADLSLVFATTARDRDMTKRFVTPRQAAAELRAFEKTGGRAGLLFGKEAKGLKNDDLALADACVMAPLNPAFRSLNLAQAVFVVGYEWFMAAAEAPAGRLVMPKETRPASKEELIGLFEQLERELEASGFLHVREKQPVMVRNLRNMLQRAGLTEQEVRTLRGVIASLVSGFGKPK